MTRLVGLDVGTSSVKGVATDCSGLVGGVGLDLGLPDAIAWSRDPAVKGYGRVPDAHVLLGACRKYLDPIPIAQAAVGDVLVLRFENDPQHFAIISNLSPMRIIHAYAVARKVCENGIDGEWRAGVPWRSLIVGCWRFRGLE